MNSIVLYVAIARLAIWSLPMLVATLRQVNASGLALPRTARPKR
jgi:hypothetical protein